MDFKNINTTAKFSNFQVLNPDFVRCKCNVFYTGENRNYSNITDEALRKFIERKGYANVPVIGTFAYPFLSMNFRNASSVILL